MKSIQILIILTLFLSHLQPALAARLPHEVRQELGEINSATGVSVLRRMKECRMTFSDGSYYEKADSDIPQIGAKTNDFVLEVIFNIPPMPGEDNHGQYSDLTARWIIRNGVPIPESGWAKNLQQNPAPLMSSSWLNC